MDAVLDKVVTKHGRGAAVVPLGFTTIASIKGAKV
jgi:hypothetical protein